MFKFLMVFTASPQKQLIYITINHAEDVLCELMKLGYKYPKSVFFPIINVEDVYNIEHLINKEWKEFLLKEIESNSVFTLEIRGRYIRVYSIQHVNEDIFNIVSDKSIFTTSKFKPYLIQ